jgi:hypothetical protein
MDMNSKGEKYLSVYWFAVLVIVAGGIVLIVMAFYGKPLDVREVEANILINKVVDCISEGSGMRDDLSSENFLQECHLNFDKDYYLEIFEMGIIQGNSNLKDYCSLNQDGVICVEKNFYYLENSEGKWVNILSVVNKGEENA